MNTLFLMQHSKFLSFNSGDSQIEDSSKQISSVGSSLWNCLISRPLNLGTKCKIKQIRVDSTISQKTTHLGDLLGWHNSQLWVHK